MKDMTMFDEERHSLLNKIREVEFAAVDLNLYLDNFPTCQQALVSYNNICVELNGLKKQYEMKYGPISDFGLGSSTLPWSWIEEPWPWETGE